MRAAAVWALGALPFVGLAGLGPFLDGYALSVLTLVFLFAFYGQAWNLILGFAGQLSLGHALFAGLGGYATVTLILRYGLSPWLGLLAGIALATAAGAVIGWLGFRFALRGVHFALLTIAFAEFIRVVFSNWELVGGTAGLFLPTLPADNDPLLSLRGGAGFFYGVTLLLVAGGSAPGRHLRHEPAGGGLHRAERDVGQCRDLRRSDEARRVRGTPLGLQQHQRDDVEFHRPGQDRVALRPGGAPGMGPNGVTTSRHARGVRFGHALHGCGVLTHFHHRHRLPNSPFSGPECQLRFT